MEEGGAKNNTQNPKEKEPQEAQSAARGDPENGKGSPPEG